MKPSRNVSGRRMIGKDFWKWVHYQTCQDNNCEAKECVERREAEHKAVMDFLNGKTPKPKKESE